ncbi:MAG: hypothetical protein HRU15_18150 [Planctomycetes bacterium]|nr:hypothetical protein [Planctomycetota bacterium]
MLRVLTTATMLLALLATEENNTHMLGYVIQDILKDLAEENEGVSVMAVGGPEHFDQNQLDDLFDV